MSKNITNKNQMKEELLGILKRNDKPTSPPKPKKNYDEVIVPFRCAITGSHFNVIYSNKGSTLFMINRIEKLKKFDNGVDGDTSIDANVIDINKFSNYGWYCPWCDRAGVSSAFTFIKCGRCREYVCGGRSTRVSNGNDIFRCHDGCGGGGPISGKIEALNAIKDDTPCKSPPDQSANNRPFENIKKSIPQSISLRLGRKS